jgi:predicted GNAT superfamily acetyltransferase
MNEISIRKPTEEEDMSQFVRLMESSFDMEDDPTSILPKHTFIGLRNTETLLGAYMENDLVGFICWWPDPSQKRSIYSHAIAVNKEHRGENIAEKLLFAQEKSARNSGFTSGWGTFDPLKSYLAYLYVGRYGLKIIEYKTNYYGNLGAEELSGETPTDRAIVQKDFLEKKNQKSSEIADVERVITVSGDGTSINIDESRITPKRSGSREWRVDTSVSDNVLGIEIPHSFSKISESDNEVSWRYATREAFTALLSNNGGDYVVTDFLYPEADDVEECTYILTTIQE